MDRGRRIAPLKRVAEAAVVDTTAMSPEEQVGYIVGKVKGN
jgi:cytidylate kinase